jgi:hypothetical protein
MKKENQNKANVLTDRILPEFKGLSEKAASKMIKFINKSAKTLSKKFHKLQASDCKKVEKADKKLNKKVEKKVYKEKIKAKVASIISTEKPKSILALPIGVKVISKKTIKKNNPTIK